MLKKSKWPVKIIGSVPTGYQYSSLRFFGAVTKCPGGGYSLYLQFPTLEEAKSYLHETIDEYGATDGTEEELQRMHMQVDRYLCLEYDAAKVYIEEIH